MITRCNPGGLRRQGSEPVVKLVCKGVEMPVYRLEPFCSIKNWFVIMIFRKKEEQLRKLYWANLPELQQFGVFMGTYEAKRLRYYLDLIKKKLRIITLMLPPSTTDDFEDRF